MDLTCFNCNKTWVVPQAHVLVAKLKFALGFDEHAFKCPNCDAGNELTRPEFAVELEDRQPVDATAGGDVRRGILGRARRAQPQAGTGPVLSGDPRQGMVIVDRLHVRKDHDIDADSMSTLSRGDPVTILNTWTDGENLWAHLGPDRWAAIAYNNEALIELDE